MIASCLCRRPQLKPHEQQQQQQRQGQESETPPQPERMSHRPCNSSVLVETVTDEEEIEDLLPPTADSVSSGSRPMPGVVYMFPKAWKERTSAMGARHDPAANSPKAASATSYFSSCTIS